MHLPVGGFVVIYSLRRTSRCLGMYQLCYLGWGMNLCGEIFVVGLF